MKKLVPVLAALGALIVACSDDVTSTMPNNEAMPPADELPVAQNDAGPVVTADAGDSGDGGQAELREQRCVAAGAQLLKPIDKVSTGAVTVLSTEADGTRTIFVDASAGGTMVAGQNPRIYLSLATATRVDITDVDAWSSKSWDLALKRYILFTNGGDGGSADGGAFRSGKEFSTVTAADIVPASFVTESFFEADCSPQTDEIGGLLTSFYDWYFYAEGTNKLTPNPGTWIVEGAAGKHFKLAILGYYARPGSTDEVSGSITLKVKALD